MDAQSENFDGHMGTFQKADSAGKRKDPESKDFIPDNAWNLVYQARGMLVKLTASSETSSKVFGHQIQHWNTELGKYLSMPLRKKAFSREFQSFETMFDALFLTSHVDSNYRFRVPLVAQVDYKGFRAIAVANIPIEPLDGLVLGFNSNG